VKEPWLSKGTGWYLRGGLPGGDEIQTFGSDFSGVPTVNQSAMFLASGESVAQ